MRSLADENIAPVVVQALVADGHDVISATAVCPGEPDRRLIEIALADPRISLTEDKNIGALAFAASLVLPGLIRLALHRFTPSAKAARLLAVLQAGQQCDGQSIDIERAGVRQRPLP